MNHCYRLLWNEATGTWMAAPESAAGRGKRCGGVRRRARATLAAGLLAASLAAHAAPQGGTISAGQGTIAQDGATTTIRQDSGKLAVRWDSFGIGAGETVEFVQPGPGAIALNRVVGTQASEILGRLNANGQVFLLNPNGVLFGRTAQVSVGGLLASTLDLSEGDFLAGRYTLRGSGGTVRNEGTIRAADGGYVALVGGQAHNEGSIVADRGSVALAAGSKVTLDFAGDGLLQLAVDQGTLDALVRNGGVVQADGGHALLTAKAADALAGTVVNNTGIVRARTLDNRGGVVRLLGGFEGGTVEVGGTLDVSAPGGGDAGFVDTSGAHLRFLPGARVELAAATGRAGRWLIDPTDITIDTPAANTIAMALDGGGTVTTSTAGAGADAGDISVNAPVTWTGLGTWELVADHDIHINAAITSFFGFLSLTAGNAIDAAAAVNVNTFMLNAGDWRQVGPSLPAFRADDFRIYGGSFLRAAGGDGSLANPYRIADIYGLQGIASDTTGTNATLAQNYLLANDIDATATVNWNAGSGFRPIGAMWDLFTGSFDGGGHVVSNLAVSGFDGVGLFGAIDAAGSVRNLGVQGGTASGAGSVGGIAGYNFGTIANVWASATVTGDYAGGVVGWNGGTVSDSHAGGAVSGSQSLGGFVGQNEGTITRSWATGTVDGAAGIGGFAGSNSTSGTITVAYATGAVHATNGTTGGFVGWNEGSIADAYATGAVTALHTPADPVVTQHTGGFVGRLESGSLTNVYATGLVTNDSAYKGGLGGSKGITATLSGAYWDRTSTGLNRGFGGITGGTGLTTTQAKTQSSYAGFDFTNTWVIYGGQTYPLLRAFLKPLTVTANDAGRTYDGTTFSGGNGVGYSATPDAGLLLGSVSYGGSSQGAKDAGTYGITASGLYSTQQGYLITYAPGTLTIGRKALTVAGLAAADKVYDGTATATLLTGGALLAGVVAGDTVSLATGGMAGEFADRNAGNGKAVTVTGTAITGASAGNYTVSDPTGLTANISPAALAVVADDKSKAAGAADPLFTYRASGFVGTDTAATVLAGSLARNPGEAAGPYAITQGSLAAVDPNYAIAYTPGTLTIVAPPAPAGGDPAADPPATQASLLPYPRPEVPSLPACVDKARSHTEAATCARTLPLRMVEEGVRLPAPATERRRTGVQPAE